MKEVSLSKTKFNSLLGAATLTMIITYLMLLSDTIIVGNIVGENSIAAINIVMPMYSSANFVAGLIGMGTAYLYCRAMGEYEDERSNGVFSQGVILALASGIVMFLLMLFLQGAYLDYMGVSQAIRTEVEAYWKYEMFVVLLIPINYLMIEMVYCDGDEMLNLFSNLIMVFGNILLSIFLCLKMGTAGASLGTVVGMTLATLTLCLHFLRKSNTMRFRWYITFRDTLEMIRLAITDAVTYICWGILGILFNKLIIVQYGEPYLVVLTVVMGVFEFSLIFDGIGEAIIPIGEMFLGEKNYDREKDLLEYAFKVCLIEGILVMAVLLVMAPVIPEFFDISNPEILPQCVAAVRILAFLMPFAAISYLLSSQYLLVRKIALSTSYAVSQSLVLDVIFSLLLSSMVGINGIWAGLVLAQAMVIVIFCAYVYFRYGKQKFPWLLDANENPTLNHAFLLTEEEVVNMRNLAEQFMVKNGVEHTTVYHTILLIEECLIAIIGENRGKKVISDVSLMIQDDCILLTLRDNGKLVDITEKEREIRNIETYVLTSLMGRFDEHRRYLITASFNRSLLRIPRNR